MIVCVAVFAGYLPDLAIFKVKVHDLPVPIDKNPLNPSGKKRHEPVFDHVFTPGEFVEARSDSHSFWPAVIDDNFHVTVVFVAAATELAVTPPNKATITNAPARKIALDRISEPYNTP
ncbi:unannotated protein [freshwater metagenome]|uniref:Unannotated protein n=1 Tax=freshwater metagenome TaxID=449393 RepID=A0A6J6GKL4_9ZZZZ